MCGRVLGAAVAVLLVAGFSCTAAYADTTCYVGCAPSTTSSSGVAPVTSSSSATSSSGAQVRTSSTSGVLPFTGADVEELTAGGVGALLVGGVLVWRGRRRRRAEV